MRYFQKQKSSENANNKIIKRSMIDKTGDEYYEYGTDSGKVYGISDG